MPVKDKELHSLLNVAFPLNPVPVRFFWEECEGSLNGDIPMELQSRIAGRLWSDVTLDDWAMIGTSPSIARLYMEPAAFLYYLPSLLVGVFTRAEYVDFALESIVPPNNAHLSRGTWWLNFSQLVSSRQCDALRIFVLRIRAELWEEIGAANQELVCDADRMWCQTQSE